MKTSQTTTNAERTGRLLGRAGRRVARRETKATQWLAGNGFPVGLVRVVFWIMKLAIIGVLLYTAFWLALLVVFALIAAWLVRNADLDEEKQPELRDGHSGVGLYAKDDWRIDMGDPDDP